LLAHDSVIPGQVGVIGTSKGGDISLMMATHSPKVHIPSKYFFSSFFTFFIQFITKQYTYIYVIYSKHRSISLTSV